MNDIQKEKIKRFVNDKVTYDTVFEFILESFIKSKPNAGVNELAASFIAIGLLQDSWKELGKYVQKENATSASSPNVGL